MPAVLGLALAGLALVATPGAASRTEREPYLAVRTGFACSRCHVNRTGGGMRTAFGNIFAQTRLARRVARAGNEGPFLDTQFGRVVSLGADVRVRTWRQFTGGDAQNPIEIAEGNLYVEARLVRERLTLYLDQALAPGTARSREFVVLLSGLPGDGYLKVGRFFLPFGLRLPDDAEYVRQRTGFNFGNSDHGVELGFEPGPLSLAVAVSNGTQGGSETNSDKQLSGLVSLVGNRLRVGVSASRNDGPTGRRDAVGAFGGFRVGRVALLGEADFIADDPPAGSRGDQFVGFVEGDVLVTQGLNLKVTYGYLDPDRSIGENARIRLRFGAELFPIQFLQLSAFYVLLQDIPQARSDSDQFTLELHGFF